MSRREEILREAQASHVKMTGPHFVKYDAQAVMDKLADRVVELEEKLAEARDWNNAQVEHFNQTIRALHARCEALERDRERLDWLSDQHEKLGEWCEHTVFVRGNSDVRAAIDAARAQSGEGRSE